MKQRIYYLTVFKNGKVRLRMRKKNSSSGGRTIRKFDTMNDFGKWYLKEGKAYDIKIESVTIPDKNGEPWEHITWEVIDDLNLLEGKNNNEL